MAKEIDSKVLLNHLGATAVCVVHAYNHKILYSNDKMKELAEVAEAGGKFCRLWSSDCAVCPLYEAKQEKREYLSAIGMVLPGGERADVYAELILWEDEMAYLVTASPHRHTKEEKRLLLEREYLSAVVSQVYPVVYLFNYTENSYRYLNFDQPRVGVPEEHGNIGHLLEYHLAQIHPDYREKFRRIFEPEQIIEDWRAGAVQRSYTYRYLITDREYHWLEMTVIKADDPETGDILGIAFCHSVDDEKQMEEQLLVERRVTYDSLPGGVIKCMMSDHPVVLNMSTNLKRLLRIEKGDFLGELIWPEEREYVMKETMTLVRQGSDIFLEIPLIGENGDKLWMYCAGKKIGIKNDRPVYQFILLDISERHRAQEQLKQEREKYRILTQSAADAVFEYYPDTGDFFIQRNMNDSAEIVPLYLERMKESRACDRENYHKLCQILNGGLNEAELQIWPSADHTQPPEWYYVQVNHMRSGGRVNKVIGTLRQISELKEAILSAQRVMEEAEREKRHAAQRFVTSVSGLYEAIYEADLYQNTIYIWKEGEAKAPFNCKYETLEQFFQTAYRKYVHPDYREAFKNKFFLEPMKRAFDAGETCLTMEYPEVTPEGRSIWMMLQVQLIENSGEIRDIMIFLRNIDDARKKEEENRQILEDALYLAKQANDAKTDFLSRMSHDIRTPMNAIIGMTAIAAAHLSDLKKVEECLMKIASSSRYLLGLINDILDLSRIERGKMSIRQEVFDFQEMIKSLAAISSAQAQERRQDFGIRVSGDFDQIYAGDELRLKQILLNVLSNAHKYTPDGGRVLMEVFSNPAANGITMMKFAVSDNGAGIEPEYLEKIFEPFCQGSNASGSTGSGLGLAITQNLVHLMNGSITVSSTYGKGSCFTVELPLKRVEGAGFPAKNTQVVGDRDLRILLVDDDAAVCEHASILLREMGLKADCAGSGCDGIRLLKKSRDEENLYNIVIVDWKMSELDGVATVRQMRKVAGRDLLVVIMSAYDWSDIEEEARAAGVDFFLSKPIFSNNLRAILESIQEPKEQREREIVFDGEKVLLVEDNELNQEIAVTLLKMRNLEIDIAKNGREAVEKFLASKEQEYRAILMDIQMPVMNGYEAAKAIRACRRGDALSVPIYAMTANAFANDVSEAIASGMNGHLAKPVDFQELSKVLKTEWGS